MGMKARDFVAGLGFEGTFDAIAHDVTVIDDHDVPAAQGERLCRAKPTGPATDDHDI